MHKQYPHLRIIFLVLAWTSIAAGQSAGTFTATGSMITPRWGHTATLLPNGKVLVAGGLTLCYYLAQPCAESNTAELYDPATGLFSLTGSLSPRAHHTGGILLSDGRVLFAANDFDITLADVELYDPTTGTFSVAGNSATLRYVESATLLNDGTVLLRGASSRRRSPLLTALKSTIRLRQHSVPYLDGPVRIHGRSPCSPMAEFSWSITRTKPDSLTQPRVQSAEWGNCLD